MKIPYGIKKLNIFFYLKKEKQSYWRPPFRIIKLELSEL